MRTLKQDLRTVIIWVNNFFGFWPLSIEFVIELLPRKLNDSTLILHTIQCNNFRARQCGSDELFDLNGDGSKCDET